MDETEWQIQMLVDSVPHMKQLLHLDIYDEIDLMEDECGAILKALGSLKKRHGGRRVLEVHAMNREAWSSQFTDRQSFETLSCHSKRRQCFRASI
jgi:hypothetical protein